MVGTYPARDNTHPHQFMVGSHLQKNHHHGGHDAEAQSPPFSLWNLLGYRDGANKKAIALLFLPDFLDVHDVSASR